MLIETPFTTGDIVTFKMVSGDELVGKLTAIHDNRSYEVSKPHGVMMGKDSFALVPWILTVDPDKNVSVQWNSVAAISKTYDSVAKEYIKRTTGLIV